MRLLHTFDNDRDAHAFSSFLTEQGIDNQLEINTIRDWSKDDYGLVHAKVWITEEDSFEAAGDWLEIFLTNPNDPRFYAVTTPINPESREIEIESEIPKYIRTPPPAPPRAHSHPMGPITFYTILICTLLFLLGSFTEPKATSYPKNLPTTPLFSPPINKALFYDYPHSYDLIDEVVNTYGLDKVLTPSKLPPNGIQLLNIAVNTPYWTGIYDKIVTLLKENFFGSEILGEMGSVTNGSSDKTLYDTRTNSPTQTQTSPQPQTEPHTSPQPQTEPHTSPQPQTPMFEKIKQGELYRLFTPCLLHAGIFHIFFNMAWLLILGKQIERRIGASKYLIFILIIGVITNTSQYIMGGPNFLGFSGVACGMIGYVWVRQKRAPWEGYELQSANFTFVAVFIFSLLAIQFTSFIFELTGNGGFAPPIANTAHITGGLIGILLAKMKFFTGRIHV